MIMVSPLQRRQQRIALMQYQVSISTDNGETLTIAPTAPQPSNQWDVVRASLKKDSAALKSFKQVADKIDYKKRHLEQYQPYFESNTLPVDIAAIFMVWLFDCKEIQQAMLLADYCLKYGAPMPEGFKSDVPTFVADEVLNWAESAFKQGHSTAPYFDQVLARFATDWKLFDQIEAKYYKLCGFMALGDHGTEIKYISEPAPLYAAKTWFEKAQMKYSKIGVNTRINDINKRLIKLDLPLIAEE
jgi:hypothetical protein